MQQDLISARAQQPQPQSVRQQMEQQGQRLAEGMARRTPGIAQSANGMDPAGLPDAMWQELRSMGRGVQAVAEGQGAQFSPDSISHALTQEARQAEAKPQDMRPLGAGQNQGQRPDLIAAAAQRQPSQQTQQQRHRMGM